MKKRLIGIDVARALAVIGMIIVNFKIAFGEQGSEITKLFAGIFEGKAAATFVVLAGVGIALMSNSATRENDAQRIANTRIRLAKKAVFLLIVGLAYTPIWIADILHFYGIYMLITLFLINSKKNLLLIISAILIFTYPLLMMVWNYDTGWNFATFEYADFWSPSGFFRNLFYNGFHPVIPWTAFMLIGLWYGKQNLNDDKFIKKMIWISSSIFILTQIVSRLLIAILSEGDPASATELSQILGTSPMPPLPLYMISGGSIAIFIVSLFIFIAKRFEQNILIITLNKTGQLALTFYVAHVMLGMGIVEAINPAKMGNYSVEFSILYALFFSLICMIFALAWLKYFKIGPLEMVMRRLTD